MESLKQAENTKTRKPIGNVRPPGGFLSSYVLSKLTPGSLGKTAVDRPSSETCWPRPLLQSLSCYCVGTSESGFHAAETERPEMTPESEMIRNLRIHHDHRERSSESSSERLQAPPIRWQEVGSLSLFVALRSVAETRSPQYRLDYPLGGFTKVSGLEWPEKSVTS